MSSQEIFAHLKIVNIFSSVFIEKLVVLGLCHISVLLGYS